MLRTRPQISIIIPVLNEEKWISRVLGYLLQNCALKNIKEILVIDGGSTDATVQKAIDLGALVFHSARGRAKQMNQGAKMATGEVLYFLHVDTLPPKYYDESILEAVARGYQVGCFQMKFDSDSRFLKFFAWFTRVNHKLCRGGDQTLYITKELFSKAGGFDEKYAVYEDNEFINRIYRMTDFRVLPKQVETSARRYEKHGAVRLQYHFGVIHLKNILGAGPDQLYDYYKRKIAV